jgi:hypothetical protein
LLFLGDDKHGMPVEVVGVEPRGRAASGDPCHADAARLPGSLRGGEEVATVKRSGEPAITKVGTPLDPGYEGRLAEEAEAGFDPATLTRRHAGRPSLSGRVGHSKRVDLRVDDETYEAIRRIADRNNRRVSDVVREAINRYLEAS